MHSRFIPFAAAVLLSWVALGSIWYTMPLLLATLFAKNYFEVGLAIGLIPLIEIIVGVPFGYFVDSGKLKAIAFDSMLSLLLVPLLFESNIQLLTALGVFLLGAGGVGIWIVATAYVANVMGRTEIKYIGYEFALMSVGWILGPVLGSFIYAGFGGVPLMLAELLLLALSSLILLKTLEAKIVIKSRKHPKLLSALKAEGMLIKQFPKLMVSFILMSLFYEFFSYSAWIVVPLLALTRNASIVVGGVITGAIYVPIMLGDALSGRLYRRGKEKSIMLGSVFLSAVMMLLAAILVEDSFYALLILSACAVFVSLASTSMFSVVVDKDKRDAGVISAVSILSGGVGGALGSVVTGATVASYQLFAITAAFCVIAAITMVYIYFAFRKRRL